MPFVNDCFVSDGDGCAGIKSQDVVGEYSVTKDRHVVLDCSRKRYLNEGLVKQGYCNLNLSNGFKTFESWDEKNNTENIDVLLEYITKRASSERDLQQACCNVDFVCYRGTLTRIASYPFDRGDGLLISVVRYKSTIFLCQFDTEEKMERLMKQSSDDDLWTYWGYKFEQYATSKTPNGQPDTTAPVNNMEQFSVAFETTLEGKPNLRIFSSGEIDCFDCKGNPIELKTEKLNAKSGFYQKIKYQKWSLQCYFAGIDEIVVGLRENSVVKRVHKKPVRELCEDTVKVRIMRNFLYDTLFLMKQELDSAQDLEYYTVVFRCQGRNTLRPYITKASSKYSFLPRFFLDHFR